MSVISPSTAGGPAVAAAPVLRVRDLSVSYGTPRRPLHAVDRIGFDLWPGESLGVIGESGCDKSSMGRGLLQLLPVGAAVTGSVELAGEQLIGVDKRRLRTARGEDIALVLEPMTRLDPLMTGSAHVVEAVRAHR